MDNPKAQGPDIDAINQRQAEMVEYYGLLNWVHEFFEKNVVGKHLTLDDAIEGARKLDAPTLFQDAQPHVSPSYQRQGAVAGVAAVVISREQVLQADFEWATDVCLRAWKTPEAQDDLFFRGSILLYHPVLYAARGLGALLRHESKRQEAQEALVQLAAHPYEQIVNEALGAMLRVWDDLPEVAWLALGLASSLSIVNQLPYDATAQEREEDNLGHVSAAVQEALSRIGATEEPPLALPAIPPAWERATEGPRVRKGWRGKDGVVEWAYPPLDVQEDFLAKVLASIPVPAAMADAPRRDLFLTWCDGLVQWTIERLHPSWSRKPNEESFEAKSTELFEWRRALFRFIAKVSLHMEPADSIRRFVEPAANCDDDTFGSLAEPFVSHLACYIMDEASLSSVPLQLLQRIVSRMMSSESWKQATWNDGSLHDAELSHMIRSIFFVEVEKAMGAARFANGNWSDISAVLPLTEPILEAHGENPTVVSAFLARCERAFEAYPVDQFVAQLPLVLRRSAGMPLGWRRTLLPARLAGLIQRFSELTQPLPTAMAPVLLSALDALVDMGDRRAAAVQTSEVFKDVRKV